MRDDRVRHIATADTIAYMYRRRPLFIFRTDGAAVAYVFGKRVWQSKAWHIDHPEPFRSAYKRYQQRVEQILADPTPSQLYGMLPALHPLERGGKPLTVGEYRDFALKAYKARQVAEIIKLIQQEGVQYIREDVI